EAFEFAKVCDLLYHFAWVDVCDLYLELSKPVLTGDDPAAAEPVRRVQGHVLDQLLRLLQPMLPLLTDELLRALPGGASVMFADWSSADPGWQDLAAEAEVAPLQKVVAEVRRFRADQGLRSGQRVAAQLHGLEEAGIRGHEPLIR